MNTKLRVLQLGSPSGLYGAERWIIGLISYLDPQKIESTVGVVNDRDYSEIPLCRMAEAKGIESVVIDGYGRLNGAAVKRLRDYIVNTQVDILHTHFYKADLMGLFAAWGTDCRVISTPHGWASKPPPSLWVYENISKCFLPFMDAVVPLSTGLMESLRRVPGLPRHLHLIENGVDVSEVTQDSDIAAELQDLRSQGKYILGYIGRLDAGKDLETLLRAMVGTRNPDWHAVLVGDGDHRQALERVAIESGISDRVSFFGFREDRLSFLRGFDVFVLPSRSEGIPRCLMESMVARVPIVSSDIPGCRNLVDGSTTGLLFPVGHSEALQRCIAELQNSKERRDAIVESARRLVETKFSCARMARQYETLYQTLGSQRRARV